MTTLYTFNNRANQHNILLVHTALQNRLYDCEDTDLRTKIADEYAKLDAMCEKHGIFCAPYNLKMSYED